MDENAPVFALLYVCLKHFGISVLDADNDIELPILIQELEKSYNVKISDLQADKIAAGLIAAGTNNYEEHWQAFETINHLFNNQHDDYDTLNPLEAEEIATGLAEYVLIHSNLLDIGESLSYSDEIRVYAGKIFYDYGFSKPPTIFPDAIIPAEAVDANDDDKNAALQELFDARAEYILEYLDKNNLT